MRAVFTLICGITLAYGAALHPDAGVQQLEERQVTDLLNCSAIHIIVARGSYEAPGEGCIGAVSNNVCKQLDNCTSFGIDYPATMYSGANYVDSETAGVVAMTVAAHLYHQSCRHTAIVLMGYSQGAQVVADTVCGNSEPHWDQTPPLNGSVTRRLIAVVQMGDPSFIADQPWDVGTSTNNGTVVGRNETTCDRFADRIQSYCDDGDPYCASGNNISVHHGYIHEYADTAADYIVSQYYAYLNRTQPW